MGDAWKPARPLRAHSVHCASKLSMALVMSGSAAVVVVGVLGPSQTLVRRSTWLVDISLG